MVKFVETQMQILAHLQLSVNLPVWAEMSAACAEVKCMFLMFCTFCEYCWDIGGKYQTNEQREFKAFHRTPDSPFPWFINRFQNTFRGHPQCSTRQKHALPTFILETYIKSHLTAETSNQPPHPNMPT